MGSPQIRNTVLTPARSSRCELTWAQGLSEGSRQNKAVRALIRHDRGSYADTGSAPRGHWRVWPQT